MRSVFLTATPWVLTSSCSPNAGSMTVDGMTRESVKCSILYESFPVSGKEKAVNNRAAALSNSKKDKKTFILSIVDGPDWVNQELQNESENCYPERSQLKSGSGSLKELETYHTTNNSILPKTKTR